MIQQKFVSAFLILLFATTTCGMVDVFQMEFDTPCIKCFVNSDEECWKQVLHFHGMNLQLSIQRYASSLAHAITWLEQSQDHVKNRQEFLDSIVNATLEGSKGRVNNGITLLGNDDVKEVFSYSLSEVEVKEHEFVNDSGEIPALHCPVPFDYHPRTWIALFSVTFVVLILCGIFFAFYFYQRRLSASRRYKFPFVVRV